MFSRFTRPVVAGRPGCCCCSGGAAGGGVCRGDPLDTDADRQSGDTAAGKSPAAVTFNINFRNVGSDSPKDVTIAFPAGSAGRSRGKPGACTTAAPVDACKIATGRATVNGKSQHPGRGVSRGACATGCHRRPRMSCTARSRPRRRSRCGPLPTRGSTSRLRICPPGWARWTSRSRTCGCHRVVPSSRPASP